MEYKVKKRFRSYVEKTDCSCWVWIGCLCKGYGVFYTHGKKHYAHRWLWEFKNGPIPDGIELDHLCQNKSCVKPSHLEAVTHAENMKRAAKQGKWNGERNSQAKRTESEVLTIKMLYQYFMLPGTMIAKAMKIPIRSVYSIISGEAWRHLELPDDIEMDV